MTSAPKQRFLVRWGDLDANGHMANVAYLNAAADTRMLNFAAYGFPMLEFQRLRIGPVILKDELLYFRELHLPQPFEVGLLIAGLSEDGKHFRIRNPFLREDGTAIATVTSTGAWLDLESRKLTPPPAQLAAVLASLPRTDDFERLGQN